MKKSMQGKGYAAVVCAAGICAFSGAALAQENVALPLDEAGAEAIALADAGAAETDVVRLHVVREREDGEDVVEVDFSYGDNSYEYMLRESDGMILEWSIEGRAVGEAVAELTLTEDGAGASADAKKADAVGDAQTEQDVSAEAQTEAVSPDGNAAGDSAVAGSFAKVTADGTELIGYEEAVRVALNDSGIVDAELAKLKFEYDGRFYDYELELREGRAEYEYKIDAQTGEIIEAERD